MTAIDERKQTVESRIILLEDQFDSSHSKICQVARDSHINKPVHPQIVQKFLLHKSQKDKEARKLNLEKLRVDEMLESVKIEIRENTSSSALSEQRFYTLS